jgi:O-antigen/teichoic acid export membrane protein
MNPVSPFRSFFKESAIYLFGLVLSRSISFLLLPIYTNVFDQTQNGIITLAYAFLGFMIVILPYGTDAALLNFYIRDKSERQSVFTNAYLMVFFSNVLLLMLLYLFKTSLTPFVIGADAVRYFVYCLAILMLDSLNALTMIVLRAENKPFSYTAINFLNVTLMMGLNIFFVVHLKFGLDGIFISNIISSMTIWLALLPVVASRFRFQAVDSHRMRQLFQFAIPFLPSGIFAMILELADRWILKLYTDVQTVGIYGAGYKLGAIMLVLTLGINTGWQPFFLQHAKDRDAKPIFAKISLYVFAGLVVCWLFFSIWIPPLARLSVNGNFLIGKEFWSGIHITPVILLAYLFQALYLLQLPSIFILEKTKWAPVFRGLGAAANIILNIILIPKFGMVGAAVATALAYFAMAVAIWFFNRKYYPIVYDWQKLGAIIGLTAVAYFYVVRGNIIIYRVLATIITIVGIGGILFWPLKRIKTELPKAGR